MNKERFEALEKMDSLLEVCKTCKIIENLSQQHREKFCLKKCALASEMKKIANTLNKTLRKRITEDEQKPARQRKVSLDGFKWSETSYDFLIKLKKRGITYKEIASEFTREYGRTFTMDSIRHKAQDLRKAGRL